MSLWAILFNAKPMLSFTVAVESCPAVIAMALSRTLIQTLLPQPYTKTIVLLQQIAHIYHTIHFIRLKRKHIRYSQCQCIHHKVLYYYDQFRCYFTLWMLPVISSIYNFMMCNVCVWIWCACVSVSVLCISLIQCRNHHQDKKVRMTLCIYL